MTDTERELDAVRVIVETLRPFSSEDAIRLLRTALVLLGLADHAVYIRGRPFGTRDE